MEMPGIFWLEARHRPEFAVVGTVCSDDTDIKAMSLGIVAKQFADLLAAPLFTLLAGADVY